MEIEQYLRWTAAILDTENYFLILEPHLLYIRNYFASVYFHETSHAKFRENKTLAK